ncbi:hypothetical protein D0859_16271 [Hortaea werneckii]|uniref:Uncharacterized protein n=1 Tax=Hortaea werneckii TaxID=91943 RepID=A0A3M7I328_HORWE|nr:hypothetical protein D0859_16271 [Hortaea werneckii]
MGASKLSTGVATLIAEQTSPEPKMNYANMIEEKHLKKGFVVATLISTIVGTLTASMTLHDKVQEKRDKKKQKAGGREADGRDRAVTEEERTYEDHLMRAGDRYATGDMITENRLQTQIIQLQQTVIKVLQDALYSGRGLTETDQRRLIAAQSAARDGSLDALEDHYARISTQRRRRRRETLPNATPRLLLPASSTSNDERSTRHLRSKPSPAPTTLRPPPRSTTRSYSPDPTLFCPYSIHLQTTTYPLPPPSTNRPETSLTCPSCHVPIPVSARDYWILSTTGPPASSAHQPNHHSNISDDIYDDDDDNDDDFFPIHPPSPADYSSDTGRREWKLTARFLVKSHTREGEFACLVCERRENSRREGGRGAGGGEVGVARSVEGLVRHLGRWHVG